MNMEDRLTFADEQLMLDGKPLKKALMWKQHNLI